MDTTLNAVNTNWADRGLPSSGGAQLADAMALYGSGENAQRDAEAEAGSVANLNNNLFDRPGDRLDPAQ